jgi:hypothetical protein
VNECRNVRHSVRSHRSCDTIGVMKNTDTTRRVARILMTSSPVASQCDKRWCEATMRMQQPR